MWNFFKTSSSQHYPYSLPFLQNYYKRPFYFPFFFHLPRLINPLFLMKVLGTSILKIWNWKSCPWLKENSKWSKFTLFKRRRWKEVNEDPNLVGNGRFHCLVGNGRFYCLMANGRKKKHLFTSSHFPPNKFYLNFQIFLWP